MKKLLTTMFICMALVSSFTPAAQAEAPEKVYSGDDARVVIEGWVKNQSKFIRGTRYLMARAQLAALLDESMDLKGIVLEQYAKEQNHTSHRFELRATINEGCLWAHVGFTIYARGFEDEFVDVRMMKELGEETVCQTQPRMGVGNSPMNP
jgi:hypothetical protein